MTHKEMWKDIKNYERLYQISNLGNVRSLDREHKIYQYRKNDYVSRKIKGIELKECIGKNGYKYVVLCKDGKSKVKNIHRLVAEGFIPNPNNLPQVNHKDGNKQNNSIDNLEWCTASYNVKHAFKNGLKKVSNKQIELIRNLGKNSALWNNKPVLQISIEGKIIKKWNSMIDVYKEKNYHWGNISACCKGKRKSAYGYKWKYELEEAK